MPSGGLPFSCSGLSHCNLGNCWNNFYPSVFFSICRQQRIDITSDIDDEPTLPSRGRSTVSPAVPASSPRHGSTSHQNGYHDSSHEPWKQIPQRGPPDSSLRGSTRGPSAGNLQSRAPLTNHGMPMSKFCYECGNKFPVPQAKYCCMCGTLRL